eukprot:741892-Prorocentrum_minimum.AAC.1
MRCALGSGRIGYDEQFPGGGRRLPKLDRHALQAHIESQMTRKKARPWRQQRRVGTASSTASEMTEISSIDGGGGKDAAMAGLFQYDFKDFNAQMPPQVTTETVKQ